MPSSQLVVTCHPITLPILKHCLTFSKKKTATQAMINNEKLRNCVSGLLTVSDNNTIIRAYPGSDFVVANTLAKWEKLELNEIYLSLGFSQKVVSRSCSLFDSLTASGEFCHLLITLQTVRTQIRPDKMSGLIS